jgi:hypothetical protein
MPNQAKRVSLIASPSRKISYGKMMIESAQPVKKAANTAKMGAAWVSGMLLEANGSLPSDFSCGRQSVKE